MTARMTQIMGTAQRCTLTAILDLRGGIVLMEGADVLEHAPLGWGIPHQG